MDTPAVFGSVSRCGGRAQLFGAPTKHAAFLDGVVVFYDEAVEKTFDGGVGNDQLVVGAEDGLMSSGVIMLPMQIEGRFLTEDDVN